MRCIRRRNTVRLCNKCYIRIPGGTCCRFPKYSLGRTCIRSGIRSPFQGRSLSCSLCSLRHSTVRLCNNGQSRILGGTYHRFQEHTPGRMEIRSGIRSLCLSRSLSCSLCSLRHSTVLLCNNGQSRTQGGTCRHPPIQTLGRMPVLGGTCHRFHKHSLAGIGK